MKQANFHIGTSSYTNGEWQGVFYPQDLARGKWFEYYCEHFDTYEINSTFYKNPTVRTMQNWYKKAPGGFRFSVKAPKAITHEKKFVDCIAELDSFYEVTSEALGDKLACILFQLPPSFDFTSDRLDRIIESLNTNFTNVIEFRNRSWWADEVGNIFKQNQLPFCNVSYPGLPDAVVSTSDVAYVRLHGDQRLFYSGYDYDYLKQMYLRLKADNCKDIFIYFNNTANVEGIRNAVLMQKIVSEEDAPPLIH
ncbi:MAG TPA: DUF72 domain-containing protein [Flavobacterium sp.]|jgi:uncharacterized protein YecE (DUF72 family)